MRAVKDGTVPDARLAKSLVSTLVSHPLPGGNTWVLQVTRTPTILGGCN